MVVNEVTEIITTDIKSILFMILAALILMLFAFVAAFVIKLIVKLLKKIGFEVTEDDLKSVQGITASVVQWLNQKTVAALKEASSDGKLTDEQKNEVYSKAVSTIKSALTNEQVEAIISRYGTLEMGLEILIESQVAQVKAEAAAMALPQPIPVQEIEWPEEEWEPDDEVEETPFFGDEPVEPTETGADAVLESVAVPEGDGFGAELDNSTEEDAVDTEAAPAKSEDLEPVDKVTE